MSDFFLDMTQPNSETLIIEERKDPKTKVKRDTFELIDIQKHMRQTLKYMIC